MTGKDISHIEIRKAGNDEFYFVFRLPSNGMFVSVFFEKMSEVVAAIETINRNSTEDAHYLRDRTATEQTHFIFRACLGNYVTLNTMRV